MEKVTPEQIAESLSRQQLHYYKASQFDKAAASARADAKANRRQARKLESLSMKAIGHGRAAEQTNSGYLSHLKRREMVLGNVEGDTTTAYYRSRSGDVIPFTVVSLAVLAERCNEAAIRAAEMEPEKPSAEAWLTNKLASGKAVWDERILREAAYEGYAPQAVIRACKVIGVRINHLGGGTFWSLPAAPPTSAECRNLIANTCPEEIGRIAAAKAWLRGYLSPLDHALICDVLYQGRKNGFRALQLKSAFNAMGDEIFAWSIGDLHHWQLRSKSTAQPLDTYAANEEMGRDDDPPIDMTYLHVLYRTGDKDIPPAITDRNGEVVLSLCKKCGQGEGSLEDRCPANNPPISGADDPDEGIPAGHEVCHDCNGNGESHQSCRQCDGRGTVPVKPPAFESAHSQGPARPLSEECEAELWSAAMDLMEGLGKPWDGPGSEPPTDQPADDPRPTPSTGQERMQAEIARTQAMAAPIAEQVLASLYRPPAVDEAVGAVDAAEGTPEGTDTADEADDSEFRAADLAKLQRMYKPLADSFAADEATTDPADLAEPTGVVMGSGERPRDGKALLAWIRAQRDNISLYNHIDRWGRRQDYPFLVGDWNSEAVACGYDEALRVLGGVEPVPVGAGVEGERGGEG